MTRTSVMTLNSLEVKQEAIRLRVPAQPEHSSRSPQPEVSNRYYRRIVGVTLRWKTFSAI